LPPTRAPDYTPAWLGTATVVPAQNTLWRISPKVENGPSIGGAAGAVRVTPARLAA
jgi:hypothetical protein